MTFSIPTEMGHIQITEAGGPDVMQLARMPTPQPGEGEVLIRVAAAGINRPDIMQRMGKYPPPASASQVPGLEVAGVIVACGQGVEWPRPGNEVRALVPGGGYAEYCLTPAPHCLPVPRGLSMAEAAEAHRLMESSAHIGKIVLTTGLA